MAPKPPSWKPPPVPSDSSAEGVEAADTSFSGEAYRNAMPAANALREDELVPINIDVPTAVVTAIGALPGILALRAEIARELPRFELRNIDELETYTRATAHAHAMRLGASTTAPEVLAELREQCLTLSAMLHTDALALASRGLIDVAKVNKPDSRLGYQRLGFDLLALTALLRMNWDKVAFRTALQLSELQHAESVAEQLVGALGLQQQSAAALAQREQQRRRLFTLFVRAYAQVRRAIAYVRWEQDADRIAPSLYKARCAGGRKPRQRHAPGGAEAS